MRIHYLLTVTALIGICSLRWVSFAAAEEGAGETSPPQAAIEEVAQPSDATPLNIEEEPNLRSDPPPMPAREFRVRSTRPRNDPHRDARACLDAGNKTAIILCAEKYR